MTCNQTETHLARLVSIDGPPLPPDARPACIEKPDLFFTEAHGGDTTTVRRAKAVCAACPWRVECFTWAADPANQVSHGIWGGFSFGRFSPDEDFITAYRAAVWPQPQPKETDSETTTAA